MAAYRKSHNTALYAT